MCVCVTSVVREWLKHGTDLGEHNTHTHDVILRSISYGMCKWAVFVCVACLVTNTHACTHMRLL